MARFREIESLCPPSHTHSTPPLLPVTSLQPRMQCSVWTNLINTEAEVGEMHACERGNNWKQSNCTWLYDSRNVTDPPPPYAIHPY